MTVLILDGHNLLHRARSGFQLGDYNVIFNFFRSLKPLVDKFTPTRVVFTLEGAPKRQLALLPEYKANRCIDESTEAGQQKRKALDDFHRQKDLIVDLLSKHFPVSVMQHPDYEADDLIYTVVKNAATSTDFVIVSSDSDFTSMLQEFSNVRLYNPISKKFVEAPPYNYVHWKALRGDGSDNVPRVEGMTDARAEEILTVVGSAVDFLSNVELIDAWRRNCDLIRLHHISNEDAMQTRSSAPTKDWDTVKQRFDEMLFKSMTKESYWSQFVATFDTLWG